MLDPVSFIVYGTPTPQGSMKAFTPKGWKRPILTSANAKLKPWRQEISGAAACLCMPALAKEIPVYITVDFYLRRPPSVPKRRIYPTVKPDGDKLLRAILDGLSGILFIDDAQVCDMKVRKRYGMPERAEITIRELVE